jgi:uncharacterized membrane protein
MLPAMTETETEGDERTPKPDGEMDPGRVLALSDGVFAIAATLLVLDLRLPEGLHGDELPAKLHELIPAVGAYGLSYLLIGLFWLGHHKQFRNFSQISGRLARLNLMFLGCVSVLPFVTSLLRYDEAIAVQLYAGTITVIFVLEALMARVAAHRGHHTDPVGARHTAIRALVTAAIFAASIGIAAIPDVGESLAKYFWLLLIPARWVMHFALRRPAKALVRAPGDRR